MDSQLKDIQPGSGVVIHLEKAWGGVRRCWLKTFRRGYIARNGSMSQGRLQSLSARSSDPRDLKFYRNQGGWYWDLKDDPFAWRDQLPFECVGLAELFLMCGTAIIATSGFGWLASQSDGVMRVFAILLAVTAAVICGLIAWFFRNPTRINCRSPDWLYRQLMARLSISKRFHLTTTSADRRRRSVSSYRSLTFTSIALRSLGELSDYDIDQGNIPTRCVLSRLGKTNNWR